MTPINNQWIFKQWRDYPRSRIGEDAAYAYSELIVNGDFDCNTGMLGDTSYGRVKAYITDLPPGKYDVTYWYKIRLPRR